MDFDGHTVKMKVAYYSSTWQLFLLIIGFIIACKVKKTDTNNLKISASDTIYADNEAKIILGKKLFFERQLSPNGTKSCASCHDPQFAFTDGYRRSLGIYADVVLHNAPTLINTKFYTTLTWANPNITTYEDQMQLPLFGQHPPEMGLLPENKVPLQRLAKDITYRQLFEQAFGKKYVKLQKEDLFTYEHLITAIAAFEQTLVSFKSPYDCYVAGDSTALSVAALRGKALFFSDRLQCAKCHPAPLFTDADQKNAFHNIGLYNLDSIGSYPKGDEGLYEYTQKMNDKGKFRTPTLRNVARTYPYMHDGSIERLVDVIKVFEKGGQQIEHGINKGNGSQNPNKSPYIKGFSLSDQERADLIAFLCCLNDE